MGAILGIVGVLIVIAIIAILWMTGATRGRRSTDPSGGQRVPRADQSGRTDGID